MVTYLDSINKDETTFLEQMKTNARAYLDDPVSYTRPAPADQTGQTCSDVEHGTALQVES